MTVTTAVDLDADGIADSAFLPPLHRVLSTHEHEHPLQSQPYVLLRSLQE
jgi:hypothetical protein